MPTRAYVVDDTSLLLVSGVPPEAHRGLAGRPAPSHLISLVSRARKNLIRSALEPAPIGKGNRVPVLNNATACVALGSRAPTVTILNEWRFEAVTMSLPTFSPVQLVSSDINWIGYVGHLSDARGRIPKTGTMSAACSSRYTFLWHAGRMAQRGPLRFPFIHLEVRDAAGALLLQFSDRVVAGYTLDRMLAATDSTILIRARSPDGFPVVLEFGFAAPDSTSFAVRGNL